MTGDILRWLLDHLAGVDDRSLWGLLLVILAVIVLRTLLLPAEEQTRSSDEAGPGAAQDHAAGDVEVPADGPSSPSRGA